MFPSEQAAGVSCTSFCSLGNLIPDLELSAPQRGHGHLTNTQCVGGSTAEEDVSRDIKFVSVKGLSVGLIKMQLLPVCPS